MALDVTPAGLMANSYVTVVAATGFLEQRLHTEPWYAAPSQTLFTLTATREAALIWATRLLDQQVNWFGQPLTRTQPLAWPMTGQIDQYGRWVDQHTIPDVIQRATAFYALALLRDVSETPSRVTLAGVRRRHIGETDMEYWPTRNLPAAPAVKIPTDVRQMLRWYGRVSGDVLMPLRRT